MWPAPSTGLSGASPLAGERGTLNEVGEDRVEIVVPRGRLAAVVDALWRAHPYEEAAYDLVARPEGAGVGFGVVGRLPAPATPTEVAERVRERLPAPHLRYGGDPERVVATVAAVGGAGDGLIGPAHASGADVYVTGDLRHHVTLDALELGLALIDAGHHATESAALPAWIARLRADAQHRALAAPVVASRTPTVPWR